MLRGDLFIAIAAALVATLRFVPPFPELFAGALNVALRFFQIPLSLLRSPIGVPSSLTGLGPLPVRAIILIARNQAQSQKQRECDNRYPHVRLLSDGEQ